MSDFSYVYVGSTPDDGTGTPLRHAFQIIDQNFANIAAGNANITISSPVTTVAGRTGNVTLHVNDVAGAASVGWVKDIVNAGNAYVDSAVVAIGSTNVAVLNTQLSSLTAQLNSINSSITTLVSNAGAQSDSIGILFADISATNSLLNGIQGTQTTIETEFTSINSDITGLTSDVNDITNNKLVNVANKISNINANISGINANVSATNSAWQANAAGLYNTIQTLSSISSTMASQLTSINGAVVTANTAMKAYVDNINSTLYADISAVNNAVMLANTTMTVYVNSLIGPIAANTANILNNDNNLNGALDNISTIINVDLPLINSRLLAANLYIDSAVASISNSWQANAATQAQAIGLLQSALVSDLSNYSAFSASLANISANVSGIESNIATLSATVANTGNVTYEQIYQINSNIAVLAGNLLTVEGTVTALNNDVSSIENIVTVGPINVSNDITGANVTATQSVYSSNGFFWANGSPYTSSDSATGNIQFNGDTISSSDAGGINLNSNGKIHIEVQTGFNSSNPGYWVDIGNLQNSNTGDLAINYSNGSNYGNTAVLTYDWWDGVGAGHTNNSSSKHATFGVYRGDGAPTSGQTRAFITFDTNSAASTAPIAVDSTGAVSLKNVNASGDVTITGNVVFNDGSKFKSAGWTEIESITASPGPTGATVTLNQTISYYAARYSEIIIKCSNQAQSAATFTTIPLVAIAQNQYNILGYPNPSNLSTSNKMTAITWSSLTSTSAQITSSESSVTLIIYAR